MFAHSDNLGECPRALVHVTRPFHSCIISFVVFLTCPSRNSHILLAFYAMPLFLWILFRRALYYYLVLTAK